MLGHSAASVGRALPGGGSPDPFLGSRLIQDDGVTLTAPAGSRFAFVEVLAKGGGIFGSGTFSAGGTGLDTLVGIVPGANFEILLPYSEEARTAAVRLNGSTILSIVSPPLVQGGTQNQQPVAGKYRGAPATSAGPGKGGGRLAGPVGAGGASYFHCPGPGAGVAGINNADRIAGGRPVACISFFRTRQAAVAFANSLYNGAWVPS